MIILHGLLGCGRNWRSFAKRLGELLISRIRRCHCQSIIYASWLYLCLHATGAASQSDWVSCVHAPVSPSVPAPVPGNPLPAVVSTKGTMNEQPAHALHLTPWHCILAFFITVYCMLLYRYLKLCIGHLECSTCMQESPPPSRLHAPLSGHVVIYLPYTVFTVHLACRRVRRRADAPLLAHAAVGPTVPWSEFAHTCASPPTQHGDSRCRRCRLHQAQAGVSVCVCVCVCGCVCARARACVGACACAHACMHVCRWRGCLTRVSSACQDDGLYIHAVCTGV